MDSLVMISYKPSTNTKTLLKSEKLKIFAFNDYAVKKDTEKIISRERRESKAFTCFKYSNSETKVRCSCE